jgi:hypothetical protein
VCAQVLGALGQTYNQAWEDTIVLELDTSIKLHTSARDWARLAVKTLGMPWLLTPVLMLMLSRLERSQVGRVWGATSAYDYVLQNIIASWRLKAFTLKALAPPIQPPTHSLQHHDLHKPLSQARSNIANSGLGHKEGDEVAIAKRFADEMGTKRFFHGDAPGHVDISFYASIVGFVYSDTDIGRRIVRGAKLEDWVGRMQETLPMDIIYVTSKGGYSPTPPQ